MGYYGVGYRRGAGALGFQGPYQPAPGRGGRVPPIKPPKKAGAASAPKPSKPFRLSRSLKKALKDARNARRKAGYATALARQLNRAFNPYRKAKLMYKLLEYGLDYIDWVPYYEPGQPGETIQDVLLNAGWGTCCSISTDVNTWQAVGGGVCRAPGAACSTQAKNLCGTPLQVPTGDIATDPITFGPNGGCQPTANRRSYVIALGWSDGEPHVSPWRHTIRQTWAWQAPAGAVAAQELPLPKPYVPGFTWPFADPHVWPQEFPEMAPLTAPTPHPMPTPFRDLPGRPGTSPWPQGRVNLQPGSGAGPKAGGGPRTDPGAGPAVQTDGGAVGPAPPHTKTPPAPAERERKRPLGAGARTLKDLADFLGGYAAEGADIVAAVYYGLPKARRCGFANTPQLKLKCIYDNYEYLDLDKVVANLIAMEAQDRALGAIGKKMRDASRRNPYFDQGRGYQTGGAGFRYHQI